MRTSYVLAAAVVASLAGSSAFALSPAASAAAQVKLTIAGSSAFQASVKSEFGKLCSDTLDTYVASSGNFQAYSCTLGAAAGSLNTKTALVYYRAEGGSVYGVAPLALNLQQLRLKVDTSCTGASPTYTCPVSGFSLAADTGSGNLEKATVQLGVTDVESGLFRNAANWPGTAYTGGSPPTAAQIASIDKVQNGNGVAFGIYTNSGLGALSLSRQSLASIFNGTYTDWSQVPKLDGSGFVSAGLPIKLCRRDTGSGTQAATQIEFLGIGCKTSAVTFTSAIFGSQNASGGTEQSCVSGNAGAIGFWALQTVAGTNVVNLDGVVPSRTAAAAGNYDFWFENILQYKTSVLTAGSDPRVLADALINQVIDASVIPSNLNTFALPVTDANLALAAIPVSSTTPVAIGTRNGDSCKAAIGL